MKLENSITGDSFEVARNAFFGKERITPTSNRPPAVPVNPRNELSSKDASPAISSGEFAYASEEIHT